MLILELYKRPCCMKKACVAGLLYLGSMTQLPNRQWKLTTFIILLETGTPENNTNVYNLLGVYCSSLSLPQAAKQQMQRSRSLWRPWQDHHHWGRVTPLTMSKLKSKIRRATRLMSGIWFPQANSGRRTALCQITISRKSLPGTWCSVCKAAWWAFPLPTHSEIQLQQDDLLQVLYLPTPPRCPLPQEVWPHQHLHCNKKVK